tara:strand:+ start:185 stop:1123 length:939 start_codon:yes stop_codon:yes gene_type:complete
MINITIENNPSFYFDYREGIKYLKELNEDDYEYPEEKTIFHIYSEFKTPKELMALKSYLATQNLEKTKLIVWSDYDISNQENVQPYKHLVDLRVYNCEELAKGTPLENSEIHFLNSLQSDQNHWMHSGIMRFLALYKFGGIYVDMDTILLRDFKPILNQDFAYQWGGATDFPKERRDLPDCHGPCAAIIGCSYKSNFIEECMQRLLVTPPSGGTCYDEDMLSYVYRKVKFTVFPSSFFDTQWLISKVNVEDSVMATEEMFNIPVQDKSRLFLDAFAWHWHNSSNRDKIPVENSKFDLLEKFIDEKLTQKGLH